MADDAVSGKAGRGPGAARPRGPAAAGERAVVFADITGSAALYEALGDARALSIITRALVVLEEQVYAHRGRVVKTIGEALMCLFADASSAGAAAIGLQQRMEHFVADASVALALKIGVRSGALIEEHGDVFGDAVNVAARLVKLANPGQILTDGPTAAAMRATLRRRAREIDRRRMKGKSNEIEIVELGWRRRSGEPFTTEQGLALERARTARMLLKLGEREIAFDSARASFTIGRDAANDLPIASTKASRQHARIEWRRDKFVLFDHSTNGTYVTLAGEPEVMVKHESFLLRGSGRLSIGEAATPRGRGIVEFDCR
ncbi:MAG: adenylate/guanylate cyclase domain-containing protein [Burkholderiales bacterium]|nr:adenylate/guanylate cyclase domain-containing protein [Burkholderiales bacterium]